MSATDPLSDGLDERAVEAARGAFVAAHGLREAPTEWDREMVRVAVAAYLAALDVNELVEMVARAIHECETWRRVAFDDRRYSLTELDRRRARAVLAALNLTTTEGPTDV